MPLPPLEGKDKDKQFTFDKKLIKQKTAVEIRNQGELKVSLAVCKHRINC